MKRLLEAFVCAAGLFVLASLSSVAINASPVEYVKICSTFGAGWFYIPGTDACLRVTSGEIRQATDFGTWYAHTPSPGTWGTSKDVCKGGGEKLVKVGTFTSSDLAVNAYGKAQTALVPLKLKKDEFVSSVNMTGGFDFGEGAPFCLSYYDTTLSEYSVLGCHDTAPARDQAATWSFAPLRTVPPATYLAPLNLVGHNAEEDWGANPSFAGELSISVCVAKGK